MLQSFLLLGFGLFMMTWCVHSSGLKVSGDNPMNPFEYVISQIRKQIAEKEKLKTLLEKAKDEKEKSKLQKDLVTVNAAIVKMEAKFKVLYKDRIEAIKEVTQNVEEEKKKLQNEMELVEEKRLHQLDAMMKRSGAMEKESLALKQFISQMSKSGFKQDDGQLKKETHDLMQTLRELKHVLLDNKDPQTTASISQQTAKPEISIPFEDEIKKSRKELENAIYTIDFKERMSKMYSVQKCANILLEKLYAGSQLPQEMPIEDLEHALDVMEIEYILSDKADEKNIAIFGISQDKVQAFEKFLEKVDQQKSYIEALKLVKAVQDDCDHAIKYARPSALPIFF